MKIIMLPREQKNQLVKDLGFTKQFINRCLAGKHNSQAAQMVRKMAIERGGAEFNGIRK